MQWVQLVFPVIAILYAIINQVIKRDVKVFFESVKVFNFSFSKLSLFKIPSIVVYGIPVCRDKSALLMPFSFIKRLNLSLIFITIYSFV